MLSTVAVPIYLFIYLLKYIHLFLLMKYIEYWTENIEVICKEPGEDNRR